MPILNTKAGDNQLQLENLECNFSKGEVEIIKREACRMKIDSPFTGNECLTSDMSSEALNKLMQRIIVPPKLVKFIFQENDIAFQSLQRDISFTSNEHIKNDYDVFTKEYQKRKEEFLSNNITIQNLLDFMAMFSVNSFKSEYPEFEGTSFLSIIPEEFHKEINVGEGQCQQCIALLNELETEHCDMIKESCIEELEEKDGYVQNMHSKYQKARMIIPDKEEVFLQIDPHEYIAMFNTLKYSIALIHILNIYFEQNQFNNKDEYINDILELLYEKSKRIHHDLFMYSKILKKLTNNCSDSITCQYIPPMTSIEFDLLVNKKLQEQIEQTLKQYPILDNIEVENNLYFEKKNKILAHLKDHCHEIENTKENIQKIEETIKVLQDLIYKLKFHLIINKRDHLV